MEKHSSSAAVPPEAPIAEPVRETTEPKKTGPGKSDPFLVTFCEPGSVVAEQFRKLKTKIHGFKDSRSLKTIMITSALDGEGKTFAAANLGITLAREIHNRVIMVDCDLRNPDLAKYFGVQNGRGLSEYIQGNGKLQELVKETGIERLRILPAGKSEVAPGDLIASKRMKALLNDLRSHTETDFVIIDATPILATAEPEVLADLVDGIIIVVRAGATPRETVEQALVSLEKEKILGTVLNDLDFKTSGLRSSYFGTNGYHYKYGSGNGNGQTTAKEDKRKIFDLSGGKREVSKNGENPKLDVRKLFHHKSRRSETIKEKGTFKKIKHDVTGEPTNKFTGRIVKVMGFSVLALIIIIILYYPVKFGRNVSKEERYFRESSNSQAKYTSKDMLQKKESDKNISPVGQNTKKSHETISELQQKQPDVTRLAPTQNPLIEETQADIKSITSTQVEKTKLNGSKDRIQHGLFTVYLHYTSEENRELIEKLAFSLKNEGFKVLGIEKVDYQNSDIRYFHKDDKAGAFILKEHLKQFFAPFPNLKNTNIKIKNLSEKYPNAKKGSVELWLNF